MSPAAPGRLRAAFDAAVAANPAVSVIDGALVESGRVLADRVDEALLTGVGQEVTKALYLIPHLVGILRELRATPSSRWSDESAAALRALREARAGRGQQVS